LLAFLSNLGLSELLLIALIAVLIFGKDLPQAASKAYLQVRKLRNAVDDLRRESGIDREIRNIERNVREAEWELRKAESLAQAEKSGAVPRSPQPTSAATTLAPAATVATAGTVAQPAAGTGESTPAAAPVSAEESAAPRAEEPVVSPDQASAPAPLDAKRSSTDAAS